jgi:plasmid stabilization system protein ParE
MNDPVILNKPAARIDLAACNASIGERNPEAARRFRFAAEVTLAALARTPAIDWLRPMRLPVLTCKALRSAQ